jgi:LmbE family N-acetylglucosaminyl deacetylase
MAERSQRVLVIVALPDDAESRAGGTVAKLVRNGAQVAYCIVTNGDKGSGDRSMTPERLAAIRQEEQRNAARVLGAETVDFLGFPDSAVENTRHADGRHRGDPTPPPGSSPHSGPEPDQTSRRPRIVTTASWPRSHWIVSIHSLAPIWPFRNCSARGLSHMRSRRSS